MHRKSITGAAFVTLSILGLAACSQAPGDGDNAAPSNESVAEAPTAAADIDIAGLTSDPAQVERGRKLFSNCAVCHSTSADQPSPAGPHLEGVVGRNIAGVEGYPYTVALEKAGGTWSPENLSTFLENPQAAYPGTAMAFAGLSSKEDREAVIAYLASLGK